MQKQPCHLFAHCKMGIPPLQNVHNSENIYL
uniref:Uncharacterized protein n=1 Tax=Rhizophora mucronata TaxID=61149 RepID=A0A2P2NRD9_RHIMU